jgi:hypothetical protein
MSGPVTVARAVRIVLSAITLLLVIYLAVLARCGPGWLTSCRRGWAGSAGRLS